MAGEGKRTTHPQKEARPAMRSGWLRRFRTLIGGQDPEPQRRITFRGHAGTRCELRILGHADPRAIEPARRSQLLVRIDLSGEAGSWGGEDAGIHAAELPELASWLRRVARDPAPAGARLRFIEPALQLEAVDSDAEHVFLRVRTCCPLAAGSPDSYRTGPSDASLVVPLDRRALEGVACEVDREAARWPEREA